LSGSAIRLLEFLAILASSSFLVLGIASHDACAAEPATAHAVSDTDLEWGPCPDFFPAGCQIAVLHGDPSQPNLDVFFRVPGNYDLPAHWHTSAERMVLVAGELNVTYDGQPAVNLKPGTYAYGPASLPHSGRCVSNEPCVLFIAFEESLDATPVASEPK
jgi:mannose-6-phosphate isomerase-like protein (cupin superfamily)